MTPSKKIRILALDGGGVRALIAVQALKYLTRKAGKPVHELFDFIAGSSTGAIMAVGVTKPSPASPQDLERLYLDNAAAIFDKRFWAARGLLGPKYGAAGLEKALASGLGNTALGDSLVPTLVTTYDIEARLPLFLTSYGVYKDMSVVDAVRASSAGPTFFPPAGKYIDGGCVANNPALCAVIEACKVYQCAPADCIVLSLGMGAGEAPLAIDKAQGWGELSWLGPLVSIFTDGVADLTDYQLQELLPAGQYLRLQMRVSGPLAEMDNVSPANLRALRQAGNQLVASRLQAFEDFAKLLARG